MLNNLSFRDTDFYRVDDMSYAFEVAEYKFDESVYLLLVLRTYFYFKGFFRETTFFFGFNSVLEINTGANLEFSVANY